MITDQQSVFSLKVITVTNISQSFYLQDGGKIKWHPDMEHNDVAVTLLSAIVSSNLAAAIRPRH